MIKKFQDYTPQLPPSAYVAGEALLIGRVKLGEKSSIWPGAVLRGDVEEIIIGDKTNIQDGTVIHTNYDLPSLIGSSVTVGHNVVLHGCRVGEFCLVGMGAVLLDGSSIGEYGIVGAGSVVPEGKNLEGGFVYMGIPAVKKRRITDPEKELIKKRADEYVMLAGSYK